MPLGASRLSFLAKTAAEAGAAGRTALTITAQGNAQVDTSQYKFGGSSANFDGVGDYLDLSAQTIALEGDWTFETWIRSDVIGSSDVILRIQTAADAFIGSLYLTNGKIATYIGGGGTAGTTVMSADTWYHLAWCRDNGTVRMYINGVQDATRSYAVDQSATNLYIGHFPGDSNTRFNGWLDDMRLSNTARYPDGTSFTPPTAAFVNDANTVFLCHADGTDGDTVFIDDDGDRAPVGIQAIGTASISTSQYKIGNASLYGGSTSNYFHYGTDFSHGSGDYTVEAWVRLGTLSGTIFNFANNGGTIQIYVSSSRIKYYEDPPGGNFFVLQTTNTISADTWYHVAVVRNSGTTALYLDGVLQASTTTSNTLNNIGNTFGLNNCYIDEVRISDTARYTSGFTPSTTAFENDSNTLLLLHAEQHDADTTVIFDDNGGTLPTYTPPVTGTGIYAVEMDGSNDGWYTSSAISPSTTSWSIAMWFRTDTTTAQKFLWEDFENGKPPVQIALESGGYINVLVKDINNSTRWQAREAGAVSLSTWHCLLASYNPSAGTASAYLYTKGNGTPNTITNFSGPTPAPSETAMYDSAKSQGIWQRGYNGILRFDGAVSDTWFDTSYIDFTNSSNRLKFVTSSGGPEDLGSDGSTPTGSAPDFFLSGPAASYGTNLGSGPTTTAQGSVTDFTTDTPAS